MIEFLSPVICFACGIFFIIITFLVMKKPKEPELSDEIDGVVCARFIDSSVCYYILIYNKDGIKHEIKTEKYLCPALNIQKAKDADGNYSIVEIPVKFRIADYGKGVKRAIISNDELKLLKNQKNSIWMLFGAIGVLAIIKAIIDVVSMLN